MGVRSPVLQPDPLRTVSRPRTAVSTATASDAEAVQVSSLSVSADLSPSLRLHRKGRISSPGPPPSAIHSGRHLGRGPLRSFIAFRSVGFFYSPGTGDRRETRDLPPSPTHNQQPPGSRCRVTRLFSTSFATSRTRRTIFWAQLVRASSPSEPDEKPGQNYYSVGRGVVKSFKQADALDKGRF
ncbi:hypothetical protein NDU88_001775 [Pleurodeles waltl]|uniref:Uncharacterized protein n=1 Tax=Pleurodeles waltl TaxID=8319 RepID=A0AAV7M1F7_PLEWA|nr:hypothetical protein NDU88_001775 [Pleurodeles waltl]